jgi:signal transduction histidine kinase
MLRPRSFQRRIFLALMAVAVIPVAVLIVAGTIGLGGAASILGTAGPWTPVAESGQALMESIEGAAIDDSAVAVAAREHQEALTTSVRNSRVYVVLIERALQLLPLLAIVIALLIGALAFYGARRLARGLSRPVSELVGWTGTIARQEPLPDPEDEGREVREFATLRTSLRDMATELEEGRRREVEQARLRSWTEMARRVAHELKNPLTPMRIAAITVARMDDPSAATAGEVLIEEISRLDEMARTFSQFGRMPEGPPSQVDMEELLAALSEQHGSEETAVVVRGQGDLPLIEGHYDSLLRAFRNLVLNALDAAGAGGEVSLTASPMDDGVQVLIRDTGPGIPHDLVDRIWEPDVTTKSRGTGLGLPLVRQTIQLHGGSVEAATWDEGGAEFRVYLPSRMPEKREIDADSASDSHDAPHSGPSHEEPGDGHPDR